jgi:predicted  nucleic acid-binding Zn-ribbon protein
MAADGSQTNLRVTISGDIADIKASLSALRADLAKTKAAGEKVAPDTGAWTRGIRNVRDEVKNLVGAYIGLQGITKGIGALFSALDRADRIGELARSAGTSTEALSRLGFAAKFSQVDVEALASGIEKFSKGLFDNEKLLNKIGVTTRTTGGAFRPLEQQILDVANVFHELPDGPERAALAIKLFGKSGADLIPLLIEGRTKLQEYGKEADATGQTISEAAAAAAGEFNDNLDRLKGTLAGVANATVQQLLPSMRDYAKETANAAMQENAAAEGGRILATGFKVVAAGAIIVKNLVEAATNVIAFLADAAISTARALTGDLGGAFGVLAKTWDALKDKGPIEAFKTYQSEASKFVKGELRQIADLPGHLKAGLKSMTTGVADSQADVQKALKALFDPSDNAAKKAIDETGASADKASEKGKKLAAILRDLLKTPEKGKKPVNGVIDSADLAVDAIKRQQTALDDLFEHSKIAIADYFTQKRNLALESIDAQIAEAEAQAKSATSTEQQSAALTKIIKLQRDRAEIGPKIAEDQAKAEEDLQKQLGDVYTRLLEAQGKTVEARRAQLESEFKDLITKLEAESDEAGVAIVRKLINVEAAKAQLDQFQSESDKVLSNLQGIESSLASQSGAGLLGGLEAEKQIDAARTAALSRLRELRQAALDYLKTLAPGSPEAQQTIQYLQTLQGQIGEVVASQHTMLQQFEDSAQGALAEFLTDAALDFRNAGEAARQFGLNVARALAQSASAALAKRAISGLTSLFGGGKDQGDAAAGQQIAAAAAAGSAYAAPVATGAAALSTAGGIVASAGSVIIQGAIQLQAAAAALLTANSVGAVASVAHGGGTAGASLWMQRSVSPLLFGNAPRYHGGGIAGLRSDEVPAILQRGEVIRTRQQEQALQARLNGSGAAPIRSIVVFSDEELADALSGPAGERVVVTHVRRNRGAVSGG